jgi:hypothetical protein
VNPSVLPPPATVVRCSAAAFAALRVPLDEVPPLRQKPHPTLVALLPPNLVKHADDQTVVGLAAVLRAIADFNLSLGGFTSWGVIAAPRFLGRAAMVAALQKFAQEGAWGISPHLIPHRSLHAPSGTVSQALKIHGPNLGVGGGPGASAEGVLVAAATLVRDRLPGVWLLLTGIENEAVFTAPTPVCLAVALALVEGDGGALNLEISQPDTLTRDEVGDLAPFTLEALLAALTADSAPAASWRLGGGGRLRLTRNVLREEKYK